MESRGASGCRRGQRSRGRRMGAARRKSSCCPQSGWRVGCLSPVRLCEPLVSIAEELPARLGSRGRGCRADGLGRARALGAGCRDDCWGPTVVGLYAAEPAALVLYAALGSSRQLITGPSAAAAALSAAIVGNAVAGQRGAVPYDNGCARNLRRARRVDRWLCASGFWRALFPNPCSRGSLSACR